VRQNPSTVNDGSPGTAVRRQQNRALMVQALTRSVKSFRCRAIRPDRRRLVPCGQQPKVPAERRCGNSADLLRPALRGEQRTQQEPVLRTYPPARGLPSLSSSVGGASPACPLWDLCRTVRTCQPALACYNRSTGQVLPLRLAWWVRPGQCGNRARAYPRRSGFAVLATWSLRALAGVRWGQTVNETPTTRGTQ